MTVFLDMLFLRCTEKLPLVTQLAVIMARYAVIIAGFADLREKGFATLGLASVT